MRPLAAVLTAGGRGAVAVIAVWGDGAGALVDRAFRPNRPEPVAESPSTNTSLVPSGEKFGSIMVVCPRPQLPGLWLVTSTAGAPTAFGVSHAT